MNGTIPTSHAVAGNPYGHLEQQLVPYAPAALPAGQRVLALVAHPDDEVFGCGGLLAQLAAAGRDIDVVICTDGGFAAEQQAQGEGYAAARMAESHAAAAVLGYTPPRSLGLPDRGLRYDEETVERLLALIEAAAPDLLLAPSVSEMHPDHRMLGLAAAEAVRRQPREMAVWFCEVGVALRPNRLLDITGQIAAKRKAMACFESQLTQRSYAQVVEGLNQFRAYTLPDATHAEAYFATTASELRADPQRMLAPDYYAQRALGLPMLPTDLPLISVLVRSSDRETLVEALDSVAMQTYPHIELIVVNTTGRPHRPLPAYWGGHRLTLVDPGDPLPRAEAANAAMQAATGEWLAFLDDDDWFDAGHLAKLAAAAQAEPGRLAFYSGVRGVTEQGEPLSAVFDQAFDAEWLLGNNFIPIHAVLFSRRVLALGCRFDTAFEVYEDWDFWLQLSRHGALRHLPGVTAVYRMQTQQGSDVHKEARIRQGRKALLQKWMQLAGDDTAQATAASMARMDAHLHQVGADLTAAHKALDAIRGQLTAAHAEIVQLTDLCVERLEIVELLRDETDALQGQVGALHCEVARQHEEAQRLHEHHGQQMALNAQTLAAAQRALADTRHALAEAQHAYAVVTLSRSWRMTEPLRKLGRRLRSLLGKG